MSDETVSPVPSFITTALGQAGAWASATLMAHGLASSDQKGLIVGAVIGIGTFAWRLASSYIKTHKLNQAIAAPAGKAK